MAFFNIYARELPAIPLEKHIIFCQKDMSEPTKEISSFIKSKLSVNSDNERTKIKNVYSEGLLKKYINAILQKNKNEVNKEKAKKPKNNINLIKHFFYVMVETEEVKKADNTGVYPDIYISTKEYKLLKQEIINELKNENYTIANNKNSARYTLTVKIEDILRTNAP
jgi:putative sterol carrier protein